MDRNRAKAAALVAKGRRSIERIEACGGPPLGWDGIYQEARRRVDAAASALQVESSGELGFVPILLAAGGLFALVAGVAVLNKIQAAAESTIDTTGNILRAGLWAAAIYLGFRVVTTGRIPFTKKRV